MRTSRLSISISVSMACIFAIATILVYSCNNADERNVEESASTSDAFYSPSVLRSSTLANLPDYISKEALAQTVSELALKRFGTKDVQITDLYVYPDIEGVEFFYILPNGTETNALLVKSTSLNKIEIRTDRLKVESFEDSATRLILDEKEELFDGEASLSMSSGDVLFSCENQKKCDPCQVIAKFSKETSESSSEESGPTRRKAIVKCGTCDGCGLVAIITDVENPGIQ